MGLSSLGRPKLLGDEVGNWWRGELLSQDVLALTLVPPVLPVCAFVGEVLGVVGPEIDVDRGWEQVSP
jgi:hypothetical protein